MPEMKESAAPVASISTAEARSEAGKKMISGKVLIASFIMGFSSSGITIFMRLL